MIARTTARAALAALALGIAGATLADLPRLPAELKLQGSADSPGPVVFRHESHVDSAHPDCVSCHPRRFSILGKEGVRRGPITHQAMEKGQACGACHGKQAFNFEECGNCHGQ
jgi:c(7)-type cytochrome triheme protein